MKNKSKVLEERIALLLSSSPSGDVNCTSAAFFLLGLLDTERYIDPDNRNIYSAVGRCTLVSNFKEADFVLARAAWISSERGTARNNSHGTRTIQHIAVVRNHETGVLCDRPHYNAPFRPSITFPRLKKELKSMEHHGMYSPFSFEFYRL